jgi:cellulose biosynthesis protein BcsQ
MSRLATGLALAGRPTLLVDLDPQGNATTGLGIDKAGLYPTVYHVLVGGEPTEKAILDTILSQPAWRWSDHHGDAGGINASDV